MAETFPKLYENNLFKPSEHGCLVALHMAMISQEAGFPPGLVAIPHLHFFPFDFFIWVAVGKVERKLQRRPLS